MGGDSDHKNCAFLTGRGVITEERKKDEKKNESTKQSSAMLTHQHSINAVCVLRRKRYVEREKREKKIH